MSLTFGQAKKELAQYQGKGGKLPTAEGLDLFTHKVLQYLLITGSPNTERAFELYALGGYITAPYEMETPLKVKVNGRIGNAVSKWFEFRSGSDFTSKGCYEATDTIFEDANEYYTAFDLPSSSGHAIGILGTVEEDCEAQIIISGDDCTGRPIFTNHKGAEIAGELLHIRKGVTTWTQVKFGKITGIVKTKTKGYTPLYWGNDSGMKGFLSDYSPVEEVPTYRRFNLSIPNCPTPAKITILAKTRLKEKYCENDRIPFDNLYSIQVAGQQVNASYNDRIEVAAQKDNFLQELVNREAVHKRSTNGQPLEVFHATSAGTIKGLVE